MRNLKRSRHSRSAFRLEFFRDETSAAVHKTTKKTKKRGRGRLASAEGVCIRGVRMCVYDTRRRISRPSSHFTAGEISDFSGAGNPSRLLSRSFTLSFIIPLPSSPRRFTLVAPARPFIPNKAISGTRGDGLYVRLLGDNLYTRPPICNNLLTRYVFLARARAPVARRLSRLCTFAACYREDRIVAGHLFCSDERLRTRPIRHDGSSGASVVGYLDFTLSKCSRFVAARIEYNQ